MALLEVRPDNIDHRILRQAKAVLEGGGVVAFPTDSSWSLCCDPKAQKGLEKLRKLKGSPSFTPTMICADIAQVSEYSRLSNAAFKVMKKHTPGPMVFILEPLLQMEKKLGIRRSELGVRIPGNPLATAVLETFGGPVFSITASRKMTQEGWWDEVFAEENLFESGWELEEIPGVDLILDPGEAIGKYLSTVISLLEDQPKLIRRGIGPWEE